MSPISLLKNCQSCLLKGEKSWKSYFSKWEALAKQEENIPENELTCEPENISESGLNGGLEEKVTILTQNRKRHLKEASQNLESEKSIKGVVKERKNIRKVIKKKKKPLKKQKAERVIKRPRALGNNNIEAEGSGNEQLELDLRTIFMDILKANKNKCEVFSVLSQTFSLQEITTTKSFHESALNRLNRQLALTYNNDETGSVRFSGNQVLSSTTYKSTEGKFWNSRNLSIQVNQNSNQNFMSQLYRHELVTEPRLQKVDLETNQFRLQRLGIDRFSYSNNNMRGSTLIPVNAIQTPQQQASNFYFQNRLSLSCPSKMIFYLNDASCERNKMLNFPALEFGSKCKPTEFSKISNKSFTRNDSEQPQFRHPPFRNVDREKSFQNLCIYKRTDDVDLNRENSNFITPKRKSSERKCFTENILQKKRRRPSKLTFFSNEDESESDDDQSANHSPLIRWDVKKRKTEVHPEKLVMDSDSDDCESIFDRIKS